MTLVFFMAPTDPRMLSTIDAILESPSHGGLVSDSLVHRYPPHPRIDGLPGEEGTFNMCSFWLVEALTRAGLGYPERLDQARLLFERVLGYANHLGLYAEQTGPQGEALGNFPQAFTHLALISAAFNLDRMLGTQVSSVATLIEIEAKVLFRSKSRSTLLGRKTHSKARSFINSLAATASSMCALHAFQTFAQQDL